MDRDDMDWRNWDDIDYGNVNWDNVIDDGAFENERLDQMLAPRGHRGNMDDEWQDRMYPSRGQDGFREDHPNAYEWLDDDNLVPTGVFGERAQRYLPFGTLDVSGGRDNVDYYAMPYNYSLDPEGRHRDWNPRVEEDRWANLPDDRRAPEHAQWNRNRYPNGTRMSTRFDDPYQEAAVYENVRPGDWYHPQGGNFGIFPQDEQLPRYYYLDPRDYELDIGRNMTRRVNANPGRIAPGISEDDQRMHLSRDELDQMGYYDPGFYSDDRRW